ncbi:hypothetical protein OH77DRAFT_1432380 [Trametes cingulata]|nr:hypothetical protein OH77DRAFT_1432380 [Trametes cingulata]
MADTKCVRHIVTGGFWEDANGCWQRAGTNVLSTFRDSPLLQHHFGWTLEAGTPPAGCVQLPARTQQTRQHTRQTSASSHEATCPESFPLDATWILRTSVIAPSGDVCEQHSWVIATDNQGSMMIGQIAELLVPVPGSSEDATHEAAASQSYIVIERFLLGSIRHQTTGCPVLRPPRPNTRIFEVVHSAAVLLLLNVQHDCEVAKCSIAPGSRAVRQERQDTEVREAGLVHNSESRLFLINTHALHNAALLRRHLPRSLLCPLPLYEDRPERHRELATSLRVTEALKRAETQKKRAATRQKKAQQAGATTRGPSHPGTSTAARAVGDVSEPSGSWQAVESVRQERHHGMDSDVIDSGASVAGHPGGLAVGAPRPATVSGDQSGSPADVESTSPPGTLGCGDDNRAEFARPKRRRVE